MTRNPAPRPVIPQQAIPGRASHRPPADGTASRKPTVFFVETRVYAGCGLLALRGELDISDAAELSSRLTATLSRGPWVIVDLSDLAFIDCGSLGVLAEAQARARLAGGDLLLAGPRGAVARLLALMGRSLVFPIFPSVSLAASSTGLM